MPRLAEVLVARVRIPAAPGAGPRPPRRPAREAGTPSPQRRTPRRRPARRRGVRRLGTVRPPRREGGPADRLARAAPAAPIASLLSLAPAGAHRGAGDRR